METIERRVRQIIGTMDGPIGPFVLDAHLQRDLGMDSIDIAELTLYLEEAIRIEIEDGELEILLGATVGQVVAYVAAKLAAKKPMKVQQGQHLVHRIT